MWIELASILPEIYGKLAIPPEVREELMALGASPNVCSWASDLPAWVDVRAADTTFPADPGWQSLDLGEKAAIALATANQPSLLLIDERAGTAIARSLGLSVTGTLGVLDEAARRKLISLPDAMSRLKQTSFRYPKAIVQRLLDEDARR